VDERLEGTCPTSEGPGAVVFLKNEYVVIELKKGKSADKVYGQCSRYMGWVRKNLAAKGAKVHGVIVARKIDDKLKAARDAHDTKVHLIEFEMKIGAVAV
jgi:RecB family endonuclease NucS